MRLREGTAVALLEGMSALAYEAPSRVDEVTFRRRLVAENIGLAQEVATRISARLPAGVTREDLASAGAMGLIDAAIRFELRGATLEGFRAYARIRIRGAIVDHLRELDPVPRSARRTARKLDTATRKLYATLGHEPDDDELSVEMVLSVEQLRAARESARTAIARGTSDALLDEEGEETQASAAPSPLEEVQRREVSTIVRDVVASLPDMMRSVLRMYYFQDFDYTQISLALGVSISRVSQIHTAAVEKMRLRLKKLTGGDEAAI